MKLLADYHTHTINSKRRGFCYYHGKSTLEENVKKAYELGLKEIAITDHGFNHKVYCTYRDKMPALKAECNRLSQKYGVNVLLGVESNIISMNGDIDIIPSDYEVLDIVLCGFHDLARAKSIKDHFALMTSNRIRNIFGSKKNIERNTQAYIKAIENNNIDIFTHLHKGPKVDFVRVAQVAAKKGTLIELNSKSYNFSDQDLLDMAQTGVKFVIDSDAHRADRVGDSAKLLDKITELGIAGSVMNVDQLPQFINYKRKNTQKKDK